MSVVLSDVQEGNVLEIRVCGNDIEKRFALSTKAKLTTLDCGWLINYVC
ncbi:hypothetical protein Pla22_24560 [Rubripirellula amarantea]|uniref:Uncharacterized protein n=1 Tax=Rubripirellula amarantea TaxID=2527999 RepID=A0A5C5WY30_9BACT|nr:hypothetical protein [Rubripirellula amarantea]TWT54802.1 hypothetical protein Pla22_24560 [Rubripirellula amarantea]